MSQKIDFQEWHHFDLDEGLLLSLIDLDWIKYVSFAFWHDPTLTITKR